LASPKNSQFFRLWKAFHKKNWTKPLRGMR
jgi:hypothetical protein